MSNPHHFAAGVASVAGPAFASDALDPRAAGERDQHQPAPLAGATATPPDAAAPLRARHSPLVAVVLSGFPGLGAVYNGSYARGVAFFLAVLGTIHLAERGQELWGMGVAFVWLFNMVDAYREARLIRAGLTQDLGLTRPRTASSTAEGLGLGAVLFLIGLVSFLDLSLGLDVDWIYELWPVGLMVAGAWFIVAAVRRVRAGRTSATPAPTFDFESASGATASERRSREDRDAAPTVEPPPQPPQGW
jgi:hypothetical protein